MRPYQLIRAKRDGETLSHGALDSFLKGYLGGSVPDYQMAAFLMAVYYRGLDAGELRTLVEVILGSGRTCDFSGTPGRRVDKHSTGGVGDKVSLILAPLVASLGVHVPMMSGRGLGHTGGTVDKLESIPGMRLDLSLDEFRDQVVRLGAALITQTPEIAPLDGRLYALRDVTATVESIPLIAASIMSKKIAEGIDALVLDVKTGSGAFLPEADRGIELARTMIGIGEDHGCEVVALVTAMDRPLGSAVGNALEVVEAATVLRGGGPADVREVTVALAAEMLVLGEAAEHLEAARAAATAALDDGRALATMQRLIEAQGGDPLILEDTDRLPRAPVRRPAAAPTAGRVVAIDTRAIGDAAVDLGAGRRTLDDRIDPRVGIMLAAGAGAEVEAGQPLAEVHAADDASAEAAASRVVAAFRIGATGTADTDFLPLISHRVTSTGVEKLG